MPNASELVSVSSRAITTTGMVIAVFAVFGLNTSVLMSSKDSGAEGAAVIASRQFVGEEVSACEINAEMVMDSSARDWMIDSIFGGVVEDKEP